ncbi:hypothetical protein R1flu_006838 [Riccia fluitans]|uniref:Uncharacterized protein n=1 Tax=Riccia fluitans TaxID=41844 RepID=A0ABD1YX57_9MARC
MSAHFAIHSATAIFVSSRALTISQIKLPKVAAQAEESLHESSSVLDSPLKKLDIPEFKMVDRICEGDFDDSNRIERIAQHNGQGPGIASQLVTLPFSMIRGGYNLMYGAVGLGMWVAGGMISYSLQALGLGVGVAGDRRSRSLLPMPPSGTSKANAFVCSYGADQGQVGQHRADQATKLASYPL